MADPEDSTKVNLLRAQFEQAEGKVSAEIDTVRELGKINSIGARKYLGELQGRCEDGSITNPRLKSEISRALENVEMLLAGDEGARIGRLKAQFKQAEGKASAQIDAVRELGKMNSSEARDYLITLQLRCEGDSADIKDPGLKSEISKARASIELRRVPRNLVPQLNLDPVDLKQRLESAPSDSDEIYVVQIISKKGTAAISSLNQIAKNHRLSEAARREAVRALGTFGTPAAIDALIEVKALYKELPMLNGAAKIASAADHELQKLAGPKPEEKRKARL